VDEGANGAVEIRIPVGDYARGDYPEWVSFQGVLMREITVMVEDFEEHGLYRDYAVYSTPEDGYKIYERETARRGSMIRRPGQRSAEMEEVSSRLFSEE
jgi:hypothetical protein